MGWAYDKYFCFSKIRQECLLDQYRLTVIKPVVFFLIALTVVSIFLIAINDNVFKKWLKFGIAWILITIFFVSLVPVYSGGWIGLNPTKDLVSIWMGALFVIISLILIIWQSIKERKG